MVTTSIRYTGRPTSRSLKCGVPTRHYWRDGTSLRHGAFQNDVANNIAPLYPMPAQTFKHDSAYLGYHAIPRSARMVPPGPQGALNLPANGTEYEMPIDAPPV